jgi:hypothetical protein
MENREEAMNGLKGRTLHYTQLSPALPGTPLAEEWETYWREVGRFLADGREGQHVLIKSSAILGFFDDFQTGVGEGRKRFPSEPFFAHVILTEEPVFKVGYRKLCPN